MAAMTARSQEPPPGQDPPQGHAPTTSTTPSSDLSPEDLELVRRSPKKFLSSKESSNQVGKNFWTPSQQRTLRFQAWTMLSSKNFDHLHRLTTFQKHYTLTQSRQPPEDWHLKDAAFHWHLTTWTSNSKSRKLRSKMLSFSTTRPYSSRPYSSSIINC